MPTWKVVNRITGEVVHAYTSDEPVEWPGMEFSVCNHIADPIPIEGPPIIRRRLTKLQFVDRLGDAAYVAILQMAKASVEVEAFVKRFEFATPEADGTSVDLDDPRTVVGITAIGVILEAQSIVPAGWSAEVLSGNGL